MFTKLASIIVKKIGVPKFINMIWKIVYKSLKTQTDKTKNEVDDLVLETINKLILELCS